MADIDTITPEVATPGHTATRTHIYFRRTQWTSDRSGTRVTRGAGARPAR